MSVTMLNDGNFKTEVLDSEKPVLVDFYADWCGPCKMLGPVVEELANDYKDKAKVCKLNVDAAGQIASEYGVMSIPALFLFKNGEVKDQVVGAVPKSQLQSMIDKHV